MWLQARRINASLEPLAAIVGGRLSDGRITGSYEGFAIEAHPWKGYPTRLAPTSSAPVDPAGTAHMLRLTLAGVEGGAMWRCRSSPSSLAHDLVSRFTAGRLLARFGPGEFKFAAWDEPQALGLGKVGGKLAGLAARELSAQLGAPGLSTPESLQQALIDAGLFKELSALRLGSHPYLPMAEFMPLDDQAGLEETGPGQLTLDVQVTKDRVPPVEEFRQLLQRAARIAQINREANPPAGVPGLGA